MKPDALKRTLNQLVNAGVHENLNDWDRKRIRLLNSICLASIVLMLVYAGIYTSSESKPILWESLLGIVFYTVPVLLNHYFRYTAARLFFVLYNAALYTFLAVAYGDNYGSEYYLLPAGICTLLFFKDVRTIAALFLLNMLCFFAAKYAFNSIAPPLHLPAYIKAYSFNHLLVFVALLLIILYFKSENREQEELLILKNETLDEQKLRSENLLLNILPAETAMELKTTGKAEPRYFEQATVLFAGFENFDAFAREWPAETLVAEIDECFSAFDAIAEKNGLEKIKTIGGTFMCAGGLPQVNKTHAVDAVRAAMEMQDFMQANRAKKREQGRTGFHLRIGIHSGSVVAGIVGTKKFAYDIWGDTVNTAARMESSGVADKVNISATTFDLIKAHFRCTGRGKVAAKNKGMIEMYFVEKAMSV